MARITRRMIDAFLDELQATTLDSYMDTLDLIIMRADIGELIKAINDRSPEAILIASGLRDGAWAFLREELRKSFWLSGEKYATEVVPARFRFVFDLYNPRAEKIIKQRSLDLIDWKLMPEMRAAVQTVLEYGMARGDNPRTTALDIVGRIRKRWHPTSKTWVKDRVGGVIGLTQQQVDWAINMDGELLTLDRNYFTRTLRDRRYDRMVETAIEAGRPLDRKRRTELVEGYKARLAKYRGETIARTEALRSLNLGANESLHQIVEEGLAPPEAILRRWKHSKQPHERPGHLELHDVEKGLDETFTNPVTGIEMMHPGDGPASEVINCRCYIEPEIDFVAAAKFRAA